MQIHADIQRLVEPPACWRGPMASLAEWTRWCCLTVGRSLASMSGRPTRLSPLGPSLELAPLPVLSVVVKVRSGDAEYRPLAQVVICLDAGAARAIVDAVIRHLCGFRGGGVLTDAERGILEYAVMQAIDDACVQGGFRGTLELERIAWGSEQELPASGSSATAQAARLHVGPLAGTLHVFVDPLEDLRRWPLPARLSADAIEVPSTPAAVALRAPFVRLRRDELMELTPGDAVFAGYASSDALRDRCRLVTENGWGLCAARIRLHSPTALTVDVGGVDVSPDADIETGDDVVTLRPLLGRTELSEAELRSLLESGDALDVRRRTLDLAMAENAHVRLFHRNRLFASAELVVVDEEAAYRVLDVDSRLITLESFS